MAEVTSREVIAAGKMFLNRRPHYYDAVRKNKNRVGTRLKWDFGHTYEELSLKAFSDWLEERGLKLEKVTKDVWDRFGIRYSVKFIVLVMD